jgi:uncharacterized protein YjbI with pentapeptide repeats
MTKADPARKPLRQDELVERLKTDRVFQGLAFTSGVTLDELDLSEARFEGCTFELPSVRGADFSGARFQDCRFAPIRLASCKFPGARFDGISFFDTDSKKGAVFAFCDLREAEAEKCNFAVGTFERCDLHDFKARECSFRGVRFNGSSFAKAISRRVVITRARFEACNFTFTDFAGVSLANCEFQTCKFVDTAFFDVDFTDAILRGCTIDKAEWERANLTRADLRGSTIAGLNLALLSGYAGLMIGESQQTELLERLGVSVSPD